MSDKFTRRDALRLAGSGTLGAALATGAASASPDRDRHVVGTSTPRATRAAERAADRVHHTLDFGDIGRAVAGRFPKEALENLSKRPDVRYVERDGEVRAIGQALPWGVDRVDADALHAEGETGEGAHVAIIDTGIDSDHYDLAANLGEGKAFGDAYCGSAGDSCRYGGSPNDNECRYEWDDDNDHGTHCAGTADAVDDGEGVVGVSTEATLHAAKVLDGCGSGSFSDVAAGIEWTADRGYDVGSMSLGASSGSETIRDACRYAYEKGVLLVAAAGNDGPCSDCVSYPAAYDTVIAVSATSEDDSLADFSSTGPEVELAAPGEDVLSTVPPESSADGLAVFSGTSMACPHVSGAGGQLMANGYTNEEARQRLRDTAEDVGLGSNEQGYGLLDAEAAVIGDSGDGDSNAAPSCSIVRPNDGDTVGGTVTVQVDASDEEDGDDSLDVEVSIDGGEWRSASYDGSDYYEYDWDTTAVDDGDHILQARATDADGATTESDEIAVTVDNDDGGDAAPTVESVTARDESRGGRPHADVAVDWTVADEDGDLDTVVTELYDSNGSSVAKATTGVSGDWASDTDAFEVKHGRGEEYEAVVTVADDGGREDTGSDTVRT